MSHYFTESDCDPSIIKNLQVASLGYGNQGHAHALNLRDSGVRVLVGAYDGSKGGDAARTAGFEVLSVTEAAGRADVIVFSLPDTLMAEIYRKDVLPVTRAGQSLMFVHGFNIHFGLIRPAAELNVVMVSPKGAGYEIGRAHV